MGRYLVVLYYQPNKMTKKKTLEAKKAELAEMRAAVEAQQERAAAAAAAGTQQ